MESVHKGARVSGLGAAEHKNFDDTLGRLDIGLIDMKESQEHKLRWLSNLYDPDRFDAIENISLYPNQSQAAAWRAQQNWLKDKVIGVPKATEAYTVKELQAFHMVGIYLRAFG